MMRAIRKITGNILIVIGGSILGIGILIAKGQQPLNNFTALLEQTLKKQERINKAEKLYKKGKNPQGRIRSAKPSDLN